MRKTILSIDMDNTLVDFKSGIDSLTPRMRAKYRGHYDDTPGIFAKMDPLDGAVEAFEKLSRKYDVYILSTAPWKNPSAWGDKLLWVQKHLGKSAYKRLVLTHHKNLNVQPGAILIDDRRKRGAAKFGKRLIPFGKGKSRPDAGAPI